jgi:transposase
MKTLSTDLRRRILATCDEQKETREAVAKRFRVSVGMVKKLLLQRRKTGEIGARHRFSGRKPKILKEHREELKRLVAKKPDLTLAQLRAAAGLECTLPAIHYVLVAMGLTYKKRHSKPLGKVDRTSSPRPGSSVSSRRRPKLT